jgi:hypothetical protein
MIGSADSPSQTNRMIQLAPTSFIALARLSAITLSQQAQSAGKSHRLASQKDSQCIRLASSCLRVSRYEGPPRHPEISGFGLTKLLRATSVRTTLSKTVVACESRCAYGFHSGLLPYSTGTAKNTCEAYAPTKIPASLNWNSKSDKYK